MRTIVDRLLVTNQVATTSELRPGMRSNGWRLWEGILRIRNNGSDFCDVSLRSTITGEDVVAPITVNPLSGISSGVFRIPGSYDVVIDNTGGFTGALITVVLDGDTGRSPDEVTFT